MKNYKYTILWNTGDMYWDNDPEWERAETLDELIEDDRLNLNEHNVRELLRNGFTTDEDHETWEIWLGEPV